MKQKIVSLLATFKTVDAFGIKYTADFPPASVGGQQFSLVHAAVPSVNTFGATQVSSGEQTDSGVLAKVSGRAHLRQDLLAITDAVHSLVLLGTAGLDGKFHMPRSAGDQALLNAARAFAADAPAFSAQLIGLGLATDFVTHLNADITAFEAAITAKGTAQQTQAGATSGLEDTAHKAANALHVLNTIVRNKYKNDAVKLGEWTTASHIEKHTPIPRAKKTEPTPPAK